MLNRFLPLLLLATLLTCSANPSAEPAHEKKTETNPDYIWDDIQRDWLQTQYGHCLKLAGLRMSCGGCPAIMLDVEFITDARGGLKSTRVLRENICGKKATPALRGCFLKFFKTNPFPKPLRNRTLNGKLGTGLAC